MNIVSVALELSAANQIKLYCQNYLEGATIDVTTEDPSYPRYRLYDRAQGLLFKGTSHPNPFVIKANLGASGPYPGIDTVILGANHNLTGLTLTLKYSDNDDSYTVAKSWTGAAGINRQSFTEANHRYWKLEIANPSANPEIGELFLTKVYSFERSPDYGYGLGNKENVSRGESSSGYSQKTKWGEERKRRNYRLTKMSDGQRLDLEAFRETIDGIKNFYIEDLLGNLFFVELPEGLPDFIAEPMGRWGIDFNILEVLN